MRQNRHKKARLLTMDELQARPCEVDGKPALFHRWVEEDVETPVHQFMPGEPVPLRRTRRGGPFMPMEPSFEVLRKFFALVEYRDGTIAKVDPELIQFTDKEGLT